MSKSKAGKITVTKAPDKVRDWAVEVINAGQSHVKRFTVKGHAVNPSELVQVAKALKDGRIWLCYLPPDTDFHAGYVPGGYILIERKIGAGGLVRTQSRLIHEAVHAAFDMRGGSSAYQMSTFDDEMCAYTAEGMYLRRVGTLASEVVDHRPLSVGFKAASSLSSGGSLSQTVINAFHSVLTEYQYSNTMRTKAGLKAKS
jgi:hypothetical protein